METKNTFFGLQTRRLREEEEKGRRRREGRREEGEDQAKVWMLAFGMELVNFIWKYMVCMEFLSNCMVRRLLQT